MFKSDQKVIIGIFLSVFLLLITTRTLTSGYHLADDHEILKISNDLKTMDFLEVACSWVHHDLTIRLRPLYYFHRVLETKLFGLHFTLWSIYTGFLAIITFSSFYLGLRKLLYSVSESLLFLIIAFIGPQMAIWWRLGPAETLGMTFLGLSFSLIPGRTSGKKHLWNNILFSVFLICASLCKESFLVCIPAFVLFKILNDAESLHLSLKESVLKNNILILPIVAVTVELIWIVYFIGTTKIGYAGVDSNIFSLIKGVIGVFKSLKLYIILAFALIIVTLIHSKLKRPYNFILFMNSHKNQLMFMFLIVVPNMILYAKSNMSERYFIPTTIGIALLFISVIKKLDIHHRQLRVLFIATVACVFVLPFIRTLKNANNYALEGRQTADLLSAIHDNYKKDDKILLVANPASSYEWSYSLAIYLEHFKFDNLFGYAIEEKINDDFQKRLADEWYYRFKGKELKNMVGEPDLIAFIDKNLAEDFFNQNINLYADYKDILVENPTFCLFKKI